MRFYGFEFQFFYQCFKLKRIEFLASATTSISGKSRSSFFSSLRASLSSSMITAFIICALFIQYRYQHPGFYKATINLVNFKISLFAKQ